MLTPLNTLGLPSPLTPKGRRRYTPDPRLVFHALRPDASDADFLKDAISGNSINSSPRASQATYINRFGQMTLAPINGMRRAASGLLVEGAAATNLLLNSLFDGTPLASQGVAVTAQAYTLSFYGTGSVELSGAHTATLTGTGASDRVTLTFTPSAGTLTLTVTGDVHWTQLEAGTWASSFIPTAGTAAVRAAEAATSGGAGYRWPMTTALAAALTSAGTLCVTIIPQSNWPANAGAIVGTTSSSDTIIRVSSSTAGTLFSHDGGSHYSGVAGSLQSGIATDVSVGWGSAAFSIGRRDNGGSWTWGASAVFDGGFPADTLQLSYLNAYSMFYRNIRVYNVKLTQAEIEALPW